MTSDARAVLRAAVDLLLPVSCAGCSVPGRWLCRPCEALLRGPGRPVAPTPSPAGLPPVTAVAAYDGAVRRLLVAHKERGVLRLAGPLGAAVASAVRALPCPAEVPVLVPVPSSPLAVRRRGHDHTTRIAAAAARRLGGGVRVVRGLRHCRAVADQAGLGAAERATNLRGALTVPQRRLAAGTPVVVVDDVLTTGATVVEAARALRSAGCLVLGAAVVAATGRRSLAVRAALD